jgi:hypothetical protein
MTILIFFVFSVTSIIIGGYHSHATCYYSCYFMMPLSYWLIISNSILCLSYIVTGILIPFAHHCPEYIVMAKTMNVGLSIFIFVITTIGLIELMYQYPRCRNEVGLVCEMVVINLVINLVGIIYRKNLVSVPLQETDE